jgi:hypothetical protein
MIVFADAVRLNQFAQGIQPVAAAKEWFVGLSGDQKLSILHALASMVQQAHPLPADVPVAIAKAGLKATHTPSVLMSRGSVAPQLARVIALPEPEHVKAFLLFLALLGISDARRRSTECANGCSHWWHEDLGDQRLVETLLHERAHE